MVAKVEVSARADTNHHDDDDEQRAADEVVASIRTRLLEIVHAGVQVTGFGTPEKVAIDLISW